MPPDKDEPVETTAARIEAGRARGIRCDELRLSDRDMAWWRDAKFGMFIHWGLYAIPAKSEWYMHFGKVPAEEYARLADEFVPRHFDAAEWVRIAQEGGMQYMVLTARHHDGFALWDSPSSYGDFCSARAAARRDFVAEYARACHDAGMRCGLYYSPMDWRFPAYFRAKELPENAALMKAQCHGQVEELMSGYGRIDVLWYDGAWLAHEGTDSDAAWLWEPLKLNRMVRRHQPTVIISPRSGWEGDFQCDEGGAEVTGPIVKCSWEKCLNLNRPSWGYNAEQDLMSCDEVTRMLVNVVGRGGNMLLNVGPDRDGVIPPSHVERLREVGAWLDRFGESIYGTSPGPFEPVDDAYVSTQKGSRVYVHVLAWPEGEALTFPPLPRKVTACRLMAGEALPCRQTDAAVEVTVPQAARGGPCTVIEFTLNRPL
jgi:alpha-L-fucosidase